MLVPLPEAVVDLPVTPSESDWLAMSRQAREEAERQLAERDQQLAEAGRRAAALEAELAELRARLRDPS